jgi:hypothetical protein
MVPSRIGNEKWRGSAGVKRRALLAKTGAAVVHEGACSEKSGMRCTQLTRMARCGPFLRLHGHRVLPLVMLLAHVMSNEVNSLESDGHVGAVDGHVHGQDPPHPPLLLEAFHTS